jgi:hypothetical protein
MHPKFCVVSERPLFIKQDARYLPHCADGPFTAYADGTELYYWHGVEVPKEWILSPKTVDPTLAITHPNAEQRRALAEILGWKVVLDQIVAKVVDTDPDPEIGTLLEATVADEPARFLRVRCGTGRDFVLPVPREMKTALEANAWTYGLKPAEYKPEVRT